MKKEIKSERLSPKKNFAEWYSQVLSEADILDKRYDVKGTYVWMPYGYKAMQNLKRIWDDLFQSNGIQEMYFPLLIPLKYAKKNKSWLEGFKKEAYWVKTFDEKEPQHILRPTGEPAMYPMFSLWVRNSSDLPIRIYETVSSFRYETRHTRPIIRDREITVWHEIHTAHETKKESEKEAKLHEKMWDEIWKKAGIFPLKVMKPSWECFPGAIGSVEYYSVMPTGKVMENGSVNMLGQAYAKKFGIKFKNKNGKEEYAWMVCTGNGARLLASVIATHGDDAGLVMPPEIAPVQVVIIPIFTKKEKEKVLQKAGEIKGALLKKGFCVELDDRDESVGSKFHDWEMKGVPLRIEIGPRDIKNKSLVFVRRDNGKKSSVGMAKVAGEVKKILNDIQKTLLKNAEKIAFEKIVKIKSLNEIKKIMDEGKIAEGGWCGSGDCWDKIKEISEGIELFGTKLEETNSSCLVCGKKCRTLGYIANTY